MDRSCTSARLRISECGDATKNAPCRNRGRRVTKPFPYLADNSAGIGTLHIKRRVGCRVSQGRIPPPLLIRQFSSVVDAEYRECMVRCQEANGPGGGFAFTLPAPGGQYLDFATGPPQLPSASGPSRLASVQGIVRRGITARNHFSQLASAGFVELRSTPQHGG